MRTREEVLEMLENLQWEKITKKELEKSLQKFFDCDSKLENGTDPDAPGDIDYSYLFTTAPYAAHKHFIDIEIYYCNGRKGYKTITGTELLMYEN